MKLFPRQHHTPILPNQVSTSMLLCLNVTNIIQTRGNNFQRGLHPSLKVCYRHLFQSKILTHNHMFSLS